MDWDTIRQHLRGSGNECWRGLEELAGTAAFQELVQREFPEQASEWSDPVTRRRFLVLLGASVALAGLAGCRVRPPVGRIMPYTRQPEQVVQGQPLFFATTRPLGDAALGLLVKSHEGRPTKIEGNPLHPASLGATDIFAQAAILDLYDPERSQTVTRLGQPRGWNEALEEIRPALVRQRERRGAGVRILTDLVISPTLAHQLEAVLADFPDARWFQYNAAHSAAPLAGAQRAFGTPVQPVYNFRNADVILSLAADFLSVGPGAVRYTRDFSQRRHVSGPERATMNRLYAVESVPTLTGARADHRLPLRAAELEGFARALAGQLGVAGIAPVPQLSEVQRRWVTVVARDLEQHRSGGLVIAGPEQPPLVQALAHALNQHLGNVGRTVGYIAPIIPRPESYLAGLGELVHDLAAGTVEMLLILGSNPVFTAPADLELTRHLQRVPLKVHLGLHHDETAAQCHWHIPEAHFLESWGDARAFDGTASIIQPLIAPLHAGRSASELVAALFGEQERNGHDLVRDYWRQHWPQGASGDFETNWERALHDGVIAGSALPSRRSLSLQQGWANQPAPVPPPADGVEIIFRADPTIYDGRFAGNGWLQELPKPLTKLTWDNAIFLSPALAERLGLTQSLGNQAGEHGATVVEVLELQLGERTVRGPAWILPGHPDQSVTVYFGPGRTRAGRVGTNVGFNAYPLRTSAALWLASGVRLQRTGQRHTLACTQAHHAMEGREPVRAATLAEYQRNPTFAIQGASPEHAEHQRELVPRANHQHGHTGPARSERRLQPLTLYPAYDYEPPRQRWGMVIDLNLCTGCSACVVACQSENNIPVVGKTEVTRGREMHWLRVDRYYRGDLGNPRTHFQPVPCMHCENAPCEVVCPVAATAHSAEGLNDMVYNRCVGTRYCSNNCPYKVRRFNFFQYADYATEVLRLGRNPEVTVRSRGVMEKCTYCVQRIRTRQIAADVEGRPLRDGEVVTACQAACPAQAIHFGDLNDRASRVAQASVEPRNYGLLAELHTRPRTTYLAELRNPNPELMTG